MNGYMPFTSSFIGATSQYPIYDYINDNISNSSNYVLNTSNILSLNIDNTSNNLQTQITATSNLIYKDTNLNTIVRISGQNPLYPISGNPVEMRFQNVNDEYLTKIIQTGELFVYHPLTPLPVGYGAGWWSVEGKIAFAITETQGLRFDVTNLQAATGATAITDATTASGAVAGATAGLATATGAGATAGSLIAGGDYGSVALGLAGGALLTTLGYLSYQAQVESNLSNNGFISQGTQVHNNISNANILLTDNISNICIAKGFINCNITKQQFINNIKTNQITYNGYNIDNVFLSKQNGGFIYNNIGINAPTSGTPITGILGGGGDRLILQPAPTAIDYTCSTGIDLSSKNYWYSASSNFNYSWYIGGSNLMTLNSNTLNLSNVIIDASNIRQAGKELTSISSNIVLTSTPNVVKRYGFLCSVNNPIYPNGGNELFYKYDIYLPSYTITQNLPYTNDPYRIFEINVFIATCYFNTIINDLPDIINYKIYMSNKAFAGGTYGEAGINLCATGFPINYKLDKIMANNIFLMRNNTNNFNYISIITRQIADVRVIITDLLN